jgi:hypothetical protein
MSIQTCMDAQAYAAHADFMRMVALAELERCDGARYDARSVAALRELVVTTLA